VVSLEPTGSGSLIPLNISSDPMCDATKVARAILQRLSDDELHAIAEMLFVYHPGPIQLQRGVDTKAPSPRAFCRDVRDSFSQKPMDILKATGGASDVEVAPSHSTNAVCAVAEEQVASSVAIPTDKCANTILSELAPSAPPAFPHFSLPPKATSHRRLLSPSADAVSLASPNADDTKKSDAASSPAPDADAMPCQSRAKAARVRTLVVAYFPRSSDEPELVQAFAGIARVHRARILRDEQGASRCFAFVEFGMETDTNAALAVCHAGRVTLLDEIGHVWHLRASRSIRATAELPSATRRRRRGARSFRQQFTREGR